MKYGKNRMSWLLEGSSVLRSTKGCFDDFFLESFIFSARLNRKKVED